MIKRLVLLGVLSAILAVLVYEYTQYPINETSASFVKKKQSSLVEGKELTYPARFERLNEDEETDEVEEVNETEQAAEATVNLGALLESSSEDVLSSFGEPERRDPSAFGYTSWVYPQFENGYMIIGVEQDRVVSIVASGTLVSGLLGNERAGFSELASSFTFERNVPVETESGLFTFRLTDLDFEMRPLAQVEDNWLQVYMDIHTDEVSSIRLMTSDVLLKQKPYSLSYTADLPEKPTLTEEEQKEVEAANERQIFEHTNHIRTYHNLHTLEWSEEVSDIAYLHSLDMHDEQYFDHKSPLRGTLTDRFETGGVPFERAGENIALKYVDGIAAVEGWLNSEGHRVNLLHHDFTYLGVGVYGEYYTQNFWKPQ
ncbi:CAP domain-containing protein [Shouchella patagoniensis]|uniref:CAP domain-containing protein n=1 Tax=Shouchella patagoniensis TaxID=228576 RepID=UPI001475A3BB|nr:CAP domain-containing protein [Shouchella patagoniensis]